MAKIKLILGITGASGAPLAMRLLEELSSRDIETHLVVSRGGILTIQEECHKTLDEVSAMADQRYDNNDIGAAIASGSFDSMGMVILPRSMKTAAGICSGYSDNLLLRAADVTIKEGRPLALAPRECPLSPIHLRNLQELAGYGVKILPPMMSYYHHPRSIEDMEAHYIYKLLDLLKIPARDFPRWRGLSC
ncbi:MAG: UbiX family flavin prenyltransferase [Oscillospiraceae bacterium]|nr:UbiX family flavin prenyltransferase [Oscillospiraceae bacterium]